MGKRNEKRKEERRKVLLMDALESLQRVGCQFWACRGPKHPLENMATCHACAVLRRAWQMGLIKIE